MRNQDQNRNQDQDQNQSQSQNRDQNQNQNQDQDRKKDQNRNQDQDIQTLPKWIVAVDEDRGSLEMARSILCEAGMRVTALSSFARLAGCIREEGIPDLILLDFYRSQQEGFKTLQQMKDVSPEAADVPLIFFTDDVHSDLAGEGFQQGAMDVVRKPYEAEVLISRVQNAISVHRKMHQLEMDAVTDALTGLLNRTAIDERLEKLVREKKGLLCLLDLDHFKSINDLFGHDTGDRILVMFSEILKKSLCEGDVCGRIGGDEFLLFAESLHTAEELSEFCTGLNDEYIEGAKTLLGSGLQIPVGISIGAVSVPEYGTELKHLFHMADQATYYVKENGRHGSRLYAHSLPAREILQPDLDLETVTAILEERNISPNAMWMGKEMFGSIYRYLVRYMDRYHSTAYRVLLTVKPVDEISGEELTEIMSEFNEMLRSALRNSDVMMECGDHQVFLLLPEIQEYDIDRVLKRLLGRWERSPYFETTKIRYECGPVHMNRPSGAAGDEQKWVAAADGDSENLSRIADILGKQNMKVTGLASGEELVDFLMHKKPDLILLESSLPGMDGAHTLEKLRKMSPDRLVPVIFMTEGDSLDLESKILSMGAADIIRKPYVPEVLTVRVRRTLQLVDLQMNLASTVERKIREYRDSAGD